jgi:hypothetical protein
MTFGGFSEQLSKDLVTKMTGNRQSSPDQPPPRSVKAFENPIRGSSQVVFTRDHDVIQRWAAQRQAEPATGEATSTGPATYKVNDGGAGIRFNFPGAGLFRPISWNEWLTNFDVHQCAFVYESDDLRPPSNRYRIVKAAEWKELLC